MWSRWGRAQDRGWPAEGQGLCGEEYVRGEPWRGGDCGEVAMWGGRGDGACGQMGPTCGAWLVV